MIRRIQKLHNSNSLFMFGARGTGKTTLLKSLVPEKDCLWINLLTEKDEDLYGRDPDQLSHILSKRNYKIVVIDEIQKVPKLLDIVHHEMEKNKKIQFILTGSSARKLKRGGANLLGGRAFSYHLYPFSIFELGDSAEIKDLLEYGSLPKIFEYKDNEDKREFLRGYVRTYIKEEIQAEQIVRQIEPFRDFLEIAAQCNGHQINFSKIGREVGVDDKTVKSYYQILEDTLVGFFLPPFHRSIRKRQKESPKFFFFDQGVKRALDRTITGELTAGTFAWGNAFEALVLQECHFLNDYYKKDFKFSYLATKDNAEIDLIIDRPGHPDLLVEIKSTERVTEEDIKHLVSFSRDWDRDCHSQVWSLDKNEKQINNIHCLHWGQGLKSLFNIEK